jgi:hypothetical protein
MLIFCFCCSFFTWFTDTDHKSLANLCRGSTATVARSGQTEVAANPSYTRSPDAPLLLSPDVGSALPSRPVDRINSGLGKLIRSSPLVCLMPASVEDRTSLPCWSSQPYTVLFRILLPEQWNWPTRLHLDGFSFFVVRYATVVNWTF